MQLYWANTEAYVIHKDPSSEACNRDDAKHRMRIGAKEVHMILRNMGRWRLCERCFPEQEEHELREAAGLVNG